MKIINNILEFITCIFVIIITVLTIIMQYVFVALLVAIVFTPLWLPFVVLLKLIK